ncbi:alpha/beta fold hydrolase [Nocardiopsis coralliicola]
MGRAALGSAPGSEGRGGSGEGGPSRPAAPVRSADGTAIAVQHSGSGPPLVLVHGSGGGLHSGVPLARCLDDRFTVYRPARRGYAPSGPAGASKRFADEAADLRAVIGSIGGPVHLVGLSYGATAALHAAAAGIEIRSLVLWEPPLYAAGPELEPVLADYRRLVERGERARSDRLLAEKVARVPAAMLPPADAGTGVGGAPSDVPDAPGWIGDLQSMAADTGGMDRWSAIGVPVLVLRGADTWQPMPDVLARLAAALPNAATAAIPGQMHFAPSLAPEAVAAEIAAFLPVG